MSSITSSHAETQVYMYDLQIAKKSIGRSPFKTDNRSLDNWVNNTHGVGFYLYIMFSKIKYNHFLKFRAH